MLFLLKELSGFVGVDERERLVGAFAQFGSAFDKREDRVEAYLVEEGVGAEIGCADAQGTLLAEAAAHAYKGGEDEQQGQGYAPAVGLETVEPRDDGAAEDVAHEEPVACGHGDEGTDAKKIHGLGDNHVGNDAKRIYLVGCGGIETGEEVAEERDVGSAGEKADDIADEKQVVGNKVIGLGADASQFAHNHHERRKGKQIAADGGVETPSHEEGVPVKTSEMRCRGKPGTVNRSAGEAEECEEGNACQIG